MVRDRRGLAPWSLSREAGIRVPQQLTVQFQYPSMYNLFWTLALVDEKGDWKGSKSSDKTLLLSKRMNQ